MVSGWAFYFDNQKTGFMYYEKIRSADTEMQAYIFEKLQKEVEHCRQKAWNIFTWVSTVLVGVTAGVFALASSKEMPARLSSGLFAMKILMITSIVVLATYGILWINRNLSGEDYLKNEIGLCEKACGLVCDKDVPKQKTFLNYVGYPTTIAFLTLGTVLAIYLLL